MKRQLALSLGGTIAAMALISLSTIDCGGGSSGTQSEAGTDSGGMADHHMPPTDAPSKETGKDSGKDQFNFPDSPAMDASDGGFTIPAEGGPTVPSGATQIVNTVNEKLLGVQVVGLTDDNNYVIYYGNTSTTTAGVYAAPLAGGTIVTINSNLMGQGVLTISHSTVFVWQNSKTDSATSNQIAELSEIWASGGTVQKPAVAASAVGVAAASPDGSKIVFTQNVNAGGTSGDLVFANADLTGQKTLLTGTATNSSTTAAAVSKYFNPQVEFTDNTYFVAAHQETSTPTLSFWDTTKLVQKDLIANMATTTGTTTPQLTSAFSFSSGTTGAGAGKTIVAATSAGALQAFALPVTTALPIDTGVTSFFVKADGTGVLYGVGALGAYKMDTLPPTAAVTVLTSGYGGFIDGPPIAFSPDGNWSIYYKAKASGGSEDLNLVQHTAAATPTALLSSTTGAVFNDAFTADSKYGLYYTSFASVMSAGAVGHLYAKPVSGAAAVTISTNQVWESNYLTGSKIAYNDNFVNTSANFGVSDIYSVDVSASPLAPVSIIKEADENYYLTTDRVTMVFSLGVKGNVKTNGIYTFKP